MVAEPAERSTAEPITAVLAERVRELRKRAGMSQADLAGEMAKLGFKWKAATVVNLETRSPSSRGKGPGRDAVTVQEFLGLALALSVPPPMLVADPRHVDQVPLAQGVDQSAWDVLLWMLGRQRINVPEAPRPSAGGPYLDATELIVPGWNVVDAIFELRHLEGRAGDVDEIEANEVKERAQLRSIRNAIEAIHRAGAPLPRIPDFVRKRAADLDVELPAEPEG